jgi:hypothetical protein
MFFGDSDFIERTKILCENYGIIETGRFHQYAENHWYVRAPLERIRKGILNYFRGEIIKERIGIDYTIQTSQSSQTEEQTETETQTQEVTGIEWDDQKVTDLAQKRSDIFFSDRVIWRNLLDCPVKAG